MKVGDLVTSHTFGSNCEYAIITKIYLRADYDYYDIVFIKNNVRVTRSHCDMEIVSESR